MSIADARYSHSSPNHNRILLFALVEAWGNKCYWCRTPKTFRELQIDHVSPQNPAREVADSIDTDAASNLALICGPCNQEKSNGEFDAAPRVDAMRARAASLASAVERNFRRFLKDNNVVKALIAVTAADLENPGVKESIGAFGALILPVIRQEFPDVLDASYTQDFTMPSSPVHGRDRTRSSRHARSLADLDAESRRAVVILEDVLKIDMPTAFEDVREFLGPGLDDEARRWIGRTGYQRAEIDTVPTNAPMSVYVHQIRHVGGVVTFTGEIEGAFAAEIEEVEPHPDFDWAFNREADFAFTAAFALSFAAERLIYGSVEFIEMNEAPSRSWTTEYDDFTT